MGMDTLELDRATYVRHPFHLVPACESVSIAIAIHPRKWEWRVAVKGGGKSV
jgi:hypothetical protein